VTWREALEEVVPGLSSGTVGPRLPSRAVLRGVVDDLLAALFAAESGEARLVSSLLEGALEALEGELAAEPGFDAEHVRRVLSALVRWLPELRTTAASDLDAAFEGDPAARNRCEVLVAYPGFLAIFRHRIAHLLHGRGAWLVARCIAAETHAATAIDLHPGAQIGPRCFIDHGTGVVIGATAVVGANVRLYQGVTLGAKSFPVDAAGQLIRGAPRHPILEDDVLVYAGATILGRVTIGRGSVIGGGVWLTRSVPPGSRILQAPVQTEAFDAGAGI
jgi:serine O-acetyltransferase